MQLISYLTNCLKNDQIIRWPGNCMPLTVYIAPFRWYKAVNESYHYNKMVIDALKIWEAASDNKISFKLVNTLQESQINISWKRVDRTALGRCYFNFDNLGRLFSAEVEIGLSDGVIHAQYQDKKEVFHTIAHEIGHAIGVDHSPYPDDIMYVPHQYGVTSISQRDKTTVKWLYEFPYGVDVAEILSSFNAPSDYNLDQLIYKLENRDQAQEQSFSEVQQASNSQIEDQDLKKLHEDQELLAKINKYKLSLQNININFPC